MHCRSRRCRPRRHLVPALVAIVVTSVLSSVEALGAQPASSAGAVDQLRLIRPAPASLQTSPVVVLFEVSAIDFVAYKATYASKWACVQAHGHESRCVPLHGSESLHLRLPVGEHSVHAFIADTEVVTSATERLFVSDPVSFTVVSSHELEAYGQRRLAFERARISADKDLQLLEWAAAETQGHLGPALADGTTQATAEPAFLVIGVKSSLVDGFPFRQAIRQTWASAPSLPPGVAVLFAGCRPPSRPDRAITDYALAEVNAALELEKSVLGDLLTSELDCKDGYSHLPNKVKQFMRFVITHERYRLAKYVMIADDDVYLRTSAVAAELRQLGELTNVYAGSSLAKHFLRPIRDGRLRDFVPESVYPMDEFPPFALGPHYLLSMDCAEFIGENHEQLQGISGLDDVSVALWLLAIQVHPQHVDTFRSLRASRCRDELLSLADLSPLAMRLVHDNLREGRGLCHGLDQRLWDKSNVGR